MREDQMFGEQRNRQDAALTEISVSEMAPFKHNFAVCLFSQISRKTE